MFDSGLPQRSEPWPQETCTEDLVKFGHEVSQLRVHTDKQTNIHADHNTLHPYNVQSKQITLLW